MKKALIMFVVLSWHFGIKGSVSLPVLAQDLDVLIAGLNDLSDDFVDGQLLADASDKKMNLVVLPFFNWFSGINTTNKKNPTTLTLDQTAEYNRLFIKYTKIYGSDDELYDYYNFGKIFLALINSANILKDDLIVLAIRDVSDVVAGKLSKSTLAHATAYMAAMSLYADFSKTAQKGFKKPFSVLLADTYSDVTAFAKKIISLKDQIVIQQLVPPVTTSPVAKVSAQSFILNNFGDSKLSALSSGDLPGLLIDFASHYETSDDFYAEYQMWAVYVPTRYWELQLLAGVSGAENAFSLTYFNNFKPAYNKNSKLLSDPYAAQLAAMALEFSITYAIARVEIQEINNHLYA